MLLVLDDLQWADRPTLLLLRHLARATNPARLLILGAYRAAERRGDTFTNALGEMRRDRLCPQLEVERPGRVRDGRARPRAGGGEPVAGVRAGPDEETEGNPFFVEEMSGTWSRPACRSAAPAPPSSSASGCPEGVKQVIARRLGRLDAQAIEWLRVAAVIGRDFDAALLERVVLLDEDEFLASLDEALGGRAARGVRRTAGRYSSRHA